MLQKLAEVSANACTLLQVFATFYFILHVRAALVEKMQWVRFLAKICIFYKRDESL